MQNPKEKKTESVKNLEQGIDNLMSTLNRKAPLLEVVFSIVHGQIHLNLFLVYDLKLKGEISLLHDDDVSPIHAYLVENSRYSGKPNKILDIFIQECN